MEFGMKANIYVVAVLFLCLPFTAITQEASYDGLENRLSNLYRLSNAKTQSISPENPTGDKGKGGMATEGTGAKAARDLGRGWKISPSVDIPAGATYTVAEINGSGAIQHIWMTPTGNWRLSILRMYWDAETEPSVEVPVGDFFAMGWGKYARISSLAVCVNPGSAFNSYWPMPFRHRARITIENLDDKAMTLFYQVDYALSSVPRMQPTSTPGSDGSIPFLINRFTRLLTASRGEGNTSELTWHGVYTIAAGGEKGKSSFT
jgi:hypothetical protein